MTRRWLMWSIPAGLFLIAFFHRPAPGVIARDLMQTFQVPGTTIGLLSATYFYSYAGLMVPAGLLIDAFGVRRMVTLGGAVMGLGTVAMATAWAEPPLFAGRFIIGLGATVTFVGALKVAAIWFPPSRFGTLAALSATVGVLGSFVATVPWAWLVGLLGWRWAFGMVATATFIGAALCYVVVRDRDGGAEPQGAGRPALADVMGGLWKVLQNRDTWPPFLTFFFIYAAAGNMMLWVIPYLRDVHGLTTTRAAVYATATSLALLVAGPLTGWLSDKLGRRKALYLGLTAGYLVTWVLFVATLGALPLGGLYALLFVMGIGGGAFVLSWPIAREVNPPHLAGVAVAVANLGGFLGAALTQGPFGALLDARWAGVVADGARVYSLDAYRSAFTACAVLVGGAVVTIFAIPETRGRNIYRARTRPTREARTGA